MQTGLSPTTVLWSMSSATCLMLGMVSLTLWLRSTRQSEYLLAAMMALAAGVSAMTDLRLAHAPDIAAYQAGLDFQILAASVIVVSLVWFVYLYLGTSSKRLAQVITGLWVVHVAAHFLLPDGAVFSEITGLERIRAPWGEDLTLASGPRSPWRLTADLANVLVFLYLFLASARAWRAGRHQRAAVIGGGSILFIVIGGIHTLLVDEGIVRTPYMISFAFLAVVTAVTYQLLEEVLRAGRYAKEVAVQNERWHGLLDLLPLLIARRDATGRIRDANAAMLDATGYSREELVGMHFAELVPTSELNFATRRFKRAMNSDAEGSRVLRMQCKDGSTRSVAWSTMPLKDANARVIGTLSAGLDLTEQEYAEAEAETARREMDRLSRATLLGEFSAGLAHELNQPLAAILSNAQAARRFLAKPSPDMDEVRAIVDDIIADDKRAGDIIHALHSMLRQDSARSASADIVVAVRTACNLMEGELRAHQVALVLRLDESARVVCGENVQIQQVVMNLMLNAIRAMDGVALTRREVSISSRVSGDGIVVSVADRGPGISAEIQPTMFEPLVSSRRGGLGMGLAICRRIVSGCGGRIWGENREGGGAMIHFSLPRAPTGREAHP